MVNPEILGKTYPATESYLVGREKIREFANATKLPTDSKSFSLEAAVAAGYPDLVAPPTFAVVIQEKSLTQVISDPEAGLDFSRVVHGDQKFSFSRQIIAGDQLHSILRVDSIKELAGNQMISFVTEIFDDEDELVCTATSTLVVRGTS